MQFPDPHFKTKHKKRRVIQPRVVEDLTKAMPSGGKLPSPQHAALSRCLESVLVWRVNNGRPATILSAKSIVQAT